MGSSNYAPMAQRTAPIDRGPCIANTWQMHANRDDSFNFNMLERVTVPQCLVSAGPLSVTPLITYRSPMATALPAHHTPRDGRKRRTEKSGKRLSV